MGLGGHLQITDASKGLSGEVTYRLGKEASETNTNNVAEYEAVLYGLELIRTIYHKSKYVKVFGDSLLVVNQMSGKWKIKEGAYKEVAAEALVSLESIKKSGTVVDFEWVPRAENSKADLLSR
jgi:ribonuclease HI